MKKIVVLAILSAFILFACAGKDVLDNDKTPPEKPHLIPHLGDTGITYNQTPVQYDNFYNSEGFEENGIDAVDIQDYAIQIMWDVLTDTDIDYLEIWRFNLIEQDTLTIATLHNYNKNYYIDNFEDYEVTPIDEDWFYFMKVFDTSGNFSVSDTVCYHLMSKATINGPHDNTTVSDFNDITFSWYIYQGAVFNLLIFDQNYNLLKSYSALDQPTDMYEVNFSDLGIDPNILQNTHKLYWEVVMSGGATINYVNGKEYKIYKGSETKRYTIIRSK